MIFHEKRDSRSQLSFNSIPLEAVSVMTASVNQSSARSEEMSSDRGSRLGMNAYPQSVLKEEEEPMFSDTTSPRRSQDASPQPAQHNIDDRDNEKKLNDEDEQEHE